MNSVTLNLVGRVCFRLRKAIPVAGLSLVVLLISAPLFSQANLASIQGTVTDQSGAAVAGASVTVTDAARGVSRTLTTDQAGEYNAAALVPGTKTVRVDFAGFKTVERTNVVLEVGDNVRVDFSIQPGTVTQTVTVETSVPLTDTSNAELGGTLTNQTINDLPLNGRNYVNLLTLRPGVSIYSGGGFFTQSTDGLRPDDNIFLLDGLTQTVAWTGLSIVNGASLAGDSQTFVPLDAIQEFQIVHLPGAEYGFKSGGVVNVGLKAGTNSIHGTAYAFGRTDGWDAKNYFDRASEGFPAFPLSLQQFGATAGGPIRKDKLFWFLSYEDQRYSTAGSFTSTSPVTCSATDPSCGLFQNGPGPFGCSALAAGDCVNSIVDACSDLNAQGLTIAPLSAKLAGLNTTTCAVTANPPGSRVVPGQAASIFPINNATTVPGTNTVFPNLTDVNQSDNGLAKIDYHINDRNTVNFYYFIGENNGTWADGANELAPNWRSLLYVRSQLFNGAWTWVPNSQWVNQLRGGYGRFTQSYLSADHTTSAAAYGIDTGVTNPFYAGFPVFFMLGLTGSPGGAWPKLVGPDSTYDFADTVSYLRGKHNFKFGGEVMDQIHTGSITQWGKGRVAFKPFNGVGNLLENFLLGDVSSGSAILTGNAFRDSHMWSYAGFLKDDWRVSSRLTLNLGVRYELNSVLQEQHNLLGNFDPNLGMVQVGDQIPSLYNGDHNDFAPRLGMAWDVLGNSKFVVRGGFTIMYSQIAQQSFMGLGNLLGAPAVPTAATVVVGGVATPGTGTINLQAVSFTGSGAAALASGWQNNSSATPIFPTNVTPVCGDGSSVAGVNGGLATSPCTIFGVDRNLRTPSVDGWSLGFETALTSNLSLDLSYVGNHGRNLIGFRDINEVNPSSPAEIACGHCELNQPFAAKFPYLAYIDQLSNLDQSNYDGLQATLTQHVSHGLSFTLGYTYSHSIDDASSNWSGAGVVDNGFQPGSYYGDSDFDIRNRFTASVTYALPGKPGYGQMLEGWQINSIVTLQSGQAWGDLDAGDDFSADGEANNIPAYLGAHWDFFGNHSDFKSDQNSIPYCAGPDFSTPATISCTQTTPLGVVKLSPGQTATIAAACLAAATSANAVASLEGATAGGAGGCFAQGKSVLVPPEYGTFGTSGRNIFPSTPFRNWDMSIYKNWKFKERLTAQFRAEFFNVLNHPEFANPSGGPNGFLHNDPSVPNLFGCGCATPDVAGENPVLGSGSNRAIQLGLKLIF